MRRKRRRRDVRWIGTVLIIMAAAAIVSVLVFGLNEKDKMVVVPEKTTESEPYYAPKETENTENTDENGSIDERYLMLINMDNPNLNDERPDDLVTMGEFFGEEVSLQVPQGSINIYAAKAAKRMFIDANKEISDRYVITSAYRSKSYQQEQYNNYIEDKPMDIMGSVLPAHASEHPTGLALDILSEGHNFADEGFFYCEAGRWLADNAHNYGFILRYPKGKEDITGVTFEPWHYRYVGEAAAKEMYENGLCLEEYLGG